MGAPPWRSTFIRGVSNISLPFFPIRCQSMSPDNHDLQAVRRAIRQRRTGKLFADPAAPVELPREVLEQYDPLVWQALADSGWAPFHYDRKADGLAEPWRVHWLDHRICRDLATDLPNLIPDLKPNNKLAPMLAACSGLALYTWLPEEREDGTGDRLRSPEKIDAVNREHLAATAAAVQNFLLLCTAAGIGTYWGSGSPIEKHLFRHLGIGATGPEQRLSAAVFVHYPFPGRDAIQSVGGALRDKRSDNCQWLKRVTRH